MQEKGRKMKSIGIIRRVDDLGRIVIPKEIRDSFKIDIGDPLEIFTQGKTVVLKKYELTKCTECGQSVDEEDKFCKHCGKEL